MIPLQIVPDRIKFSSPRTPTGEALCGGYV